MSPRKRSSRKDDEGWGLSAFVIGAFLLWIVVGSLSAQAFTVLVFGALVTLTLALYIRSRRSRTEVVLPPAPILSVREPVPAKMRFDVFRRDGFRCTYCGRGEPEGARLHADHVVPVARGGRTEMDNLVTACQDCNLGKSASDLVGD